MKIVLLQWFSYDRFDTLFVLDSLTACSVDALVFKARLRAERVCCVNIWRQKENLAAEIMKFNKLAAMQELQI